MTGMQPSGDTVACHHLLERTGSLLRIFISETSTAQSPSNEILNSRSVAAWRVKSNCVNKVLRSQKISVLLPRLTPV